MVQRTGYRHLDLLSIRLTDINEKVVRGVTIGLLMIDFNGGMDFIESERDNKHKTATSDCTCVFNFAY